MASNCRIARAGLCFAILASILFVNGTQLLRNMRLRETIARAKALLAWKDPKSEDFHWVQRVRIHTDYLRVHHYKFRSSDRFRINLGLADAAYAWDSRRISTARKKYVVEFTIVFCRISPDRFRMHLTGQDGISKELEFDGDFRLIKGNSLGISGVGYLDSYERFEVDVGSQDLFRFDVTAEPLFY